MHDNQTFSDQTPRPAAAREAGGPTVPSAFTTLGRSVLPRIEREGEALRVVHEDRVRYETIAKIGEGGMGEVRRVRDHDIGRDVAIKRLHGNLKTSGGLSRFVSEIRTVGLLEHPNIVPIHDVGVDADGNYFFVMKYLDGLPVDAVIEGLRKRDPVMCARFTIEQRLGIIRGVLHALEYAHARGIIHRDVKPANVMVGPFGEVVLMDWGVAKVLAAPESMSSGTELPASPSATATRMGTMIGTPAYMSPEQFRGDLDKIDARSDLYAVGVMMFELLSLENPVAALPDVEAVKAAVLARDAVWDARVPRPPGVGADLKWMTWRATQQDPEARFPSARAMLDELDLIAHGLCRVDCVGTALKRSTGALGRFVDADTPRAVFLVAGLAVASVSTVVGTVGLIAYLAVT